MKYQNRKEGYYTINEKAYPSVTTILKVIGKPALLYWAFNQGVELSRANPNDEIKQLQGKFRDVSSKAFARGSRVHDMIEAYFKTGEFIEPLFEDPYYNAFKQFVEEHHVECLESEFQICDDEFGFAGTCDFYGLVDGKKSIMDFKTGKGLYPEVGLQLTAYSHASKREVENLVAVCFKEDGTYEMKNFTPETYFEDFLAVKRVFMWSIS